MPRFNSLYVFEERGSSRQDMDPHYDPNGKFFTTVDGVPVRKLFVGNLPHEGNFNVTQTALGNVFKPFGTLVNISLVQKADSKPFAFVTFLTPQEAARALIRKGQICLARKRLYLSPADSWHQPIELPNGDMVWDRRKQEPKEEDVPVCNDEGEDADGSESASTSNDEVAPLMNYGPAEEEDNLELESCPIDKLNDDCLQLIFELIPIPERCTLSRVCQRWRELNSYYWKSFKKLDFTVYPLDQVILSDEKLNYFLHLCPNVTSLNIAQDDNDFTSEAIVIIAKSCKDLEEIHMRNIIIQKRSLAYLANSCSKLKSFSMDASDKHHDAEMSSLVKKCKNLESISLKYGTKTSGIWLKQLQSPLRSLWLQMYEFNPDYLIDGIAKVKSTLRELSFVSCSKLRSQDLLKIVQMCPGLTKFTLSGMVAFFDTQAIYPITQLANLEVLDLEHNRLVTDKFLQALVEGCPKLRHLNLSGIECYGLTERGLSLLVHLPELTHLRMACIKVTDSLLKTLSKKLKLKHLDVMGNQNITDGGCIEILNNCSQLESLDLAGCILVTNETILAAVNILSNDPSRKKLNIVCGDTLVKEEPWFHENDAMKRLNVDLKSTIISNVFDDIYHMDSDMDNSEDSFDDYDVYDEYNHYNHYFSDSDDNIDMFDVIMNNYELYIGEDDQDYF